MCPCRWSISPKPGSTQVSAWSRSASRCSSTSSTSSEARPRQTSTATSRRPKRASPWKHLHPLACGGEGPPGSCGLKNAKDEKEKRLIHPLRFWTVAVCSDSMRWLKAGLVPPSFSIQQKKTSKTKVIVSRQTPPPPPPCPRPTHLRISFNAVYNITSATHACVQQQREDA